MNQMLFAFPNCLHGIKVVHNYLSGLRSWHILGLLQNSPTFGLTHTRTNSEQPPELHSSSVNASPCPCTRPWWGRTSSTVFSFGPLTTRRTLRAGAYPEKGSEAGEGSREQVLRGAAEGTGVV